MQTDIKMLELNWWPQLIWFNMEKSRVEDKAEQMHASGGARICMLHGNISTLSVS